MPKILLTQHMLGLGGTDRVGCLLASGFADAGFEVDQLFICNNGPGTKSLQPVIDPRVRQTYLSARPRNRTIDLVRNLPALVATMKRVRPDCVMSTCNNMNWITALAVFMSGIGAKLVMKTTNPVVRSADRGIFAAVRKHFYAQAFTYADAVLPLCHAETALLAQQFPKATSRFQTAINPYVTTAMLAGSSMPRRETLTKIILGVGRFEDQKRFDLLIRAFARVEHRHARLVILGDGSQHTHCQHLCRELGVADRVELPGFVADATRWYHRADAFVLTSVFEGLPAVVLEAMAANCPVIATNCFLAAHELLARGAGCHVVDSPEPAMIARLIDQSLSMPRPVSLSGIAETYSLENGIRSHVQIVSGILNA